jgi:hypothetical protein
MTLLIEKFCLPVFTGNRSDSHVLPLDVTRDLLAYEKLLVELAKHLFKRDNPAIQRIPKEFLDKSLAIQTIESGSLSPALALMADEAVSAPTFKPFFEAKAAESYFKESHDLIVKCVGSQGSDIPEEFPPKLLSYFNKLGRSLKLGETLCLTSSDNAITAKLTPARRKELVLAASQNYEQEIDIYASLIRVSCDQKIFVLKMKDKPEFSIPMPKNYKGKLDDFLGSTRNLIFLSGIGSFDSADKLDKIIKVKSLRFLYNCELDAAFNDLAKLKEGWYDGEGKALDPENLANIADIFITHFPECMPLPAIVPTFDGNLLIEWDIDGLPSIDIDIAAKTARFQVFGLNNYEDLIKINFSLKDKSSIQLFFSILKDYVK